MRKAVINLLFVALLITGCFDENDFKSPEVVSVTPSHNSMDVESDIIVTVEFSKSMDTVKTNCEFSLNSGSGPVEGYFSWENDDRRMIFTPRENLPVAEKFTIRITKSAEDKTGNDLKNELVSVFYIGGEDDSPFVLSCTPLENSTGNLPDTVLTINFSEPVDLNNIYNGISISPPVQGRFTWNAGVSDSSTITYTPLYGFEYGVTYTVKIDESIKDITGNMLRETVSFSFTVGDDFVKPSLRVWQDLTPTLNFDESTATHGAEKNARIVIRFSEIIKTDNLKSAISLSPTSSFFITTEVSGGATAAYINFTEELVSEETYTLRISSSITDLQGNELLKDYRYCFVTDGADSIAPVVSKIGDLADPVVIWNIGEIQLLTLKAVPLYYDSIFIDFSSGEGGEAVQINPLSLSIYAENIAGGGGEAFVINIDWPEISGMTRFTRLKFGLYNVLPGNTYKIVIKGGASGLKDINGNCMKKDFIQIVKFPLGP